MTTLPADLPKRLRAAGLKVTEIDGWRSRGRPASTGGFKPVGVLNHHTGAHDKIGDFANDLDYAKWMFLEGRPEAGLPPPLVQIGLSAEGRVFIGAAGRANHAGTAKASGSVAQGDGNFLYVGIEWMLSGAQPIPKKMYDAGVKLNAVLIEWMGNSVQTISCHYQTSVTGKWDIGDPNGIPFRGHKVFDVTKFRQAVKRYQNAKDPSPVKDFTVLTFQHTSMQFGDSDKQMESDVQKIFRRDRHILTGTEAGGKAAQPLPDLLRAAAREHDYRLHRVNSLWVAVHKSVVDKGWHTGYVPVLKASDGDRPHTARGIPHVSFVNEDLGRIHVGVGHYLTRGRPNPRSPEYGVNLKWNIKYADAIGEWAKSRGKGQDLVFYSGDQNIVDRTEDTFFGHPLTSAWDELEKWQSTGHGNIDVVASFDPDRRVEAKGIRALDDKELHLHTDHFLVEAEYRVRHLKEKR